MGCFSYKCQECGRGVLSSSFSGEQVHIFRLYKGKVVHQMTGEYDSYGSVFIDGTQNERVQHSLRKSRSWPPEKESGLDSYYDISTGYAYIHVDCYKGTPPTFVSVGDPDQGWGGEDEEECYFGSLAPEGHKYKKRKPVKGWNAKDAACLEAIERFLEYGCRPTIELKRMFMSRRLTPKNPTPLVTIKDVIDWPMNECSKVTHLVTDGVAQELVKRLEKGFPLYYEPRDIEGLLFEVCIGISLISLLHLAGVRLPEIKDDFLKAVVSTVKGDKVEITEDMDVLKKYKKMREEELALIE